MQLAEGVFKVDGIRVAKVYLLVTQDGPCWWTQGRRAIPRRILRFIQRLGRQPRDLRDIVLTHCDIDHVGSVVDLNAPTGARVAIHEFDAPVPWRVRSAEGRVRDDSALPGVSWSLSSTRCVTVTYAPWNVCRGWHIVRRPKAPTSRPSGRYAVGLRPSLDPDAYLDLCAAVEDHPNLRSLRP
jgi:Metallo-beta-lactamase superfamily